MSPMCFSIYMKIILSKVLK
ncbi:unnamed protein product [Timema podura]|uniref:Uncharacterized protein n=1 Tax=Timema podura TaxID=61482 RepID=A0ABN7PPE9_TIMPD|nr:unnamed protein product [Timema podura]